VGLLKSDERGSVLTINYSVLFLPAYLGQAAMQAAKGLWIKWEVAPRYNIDGLVRMLSAAKRQE